MSIALTVVGCIAFVMNLIPLTMRGLNSPNENDRFWTMIQTCCLTIIFATTVAYTHV